MGVGLVSKTQQRKNAKADKDISHMLKTESRFCVENMVNSRKARRKSSLIYTPACPMLTYSFSPGSCLSIYLKFGVKVQLFWQICQGQADRVGVASRAISVEDLS